MAFSTLRPSPSTIAWGLLFALPPGVGVTGLVTMVVGEGTLDPFGLLAGAVTTLVIFLLVVATQATGSAQPSAARTRLD